jgi:hypothetical protein
VKIEQWLLEKTFFLGMGRLRQTITTLGLPFKHPEALPLGLLWPGCSGPQTAGAVSPDRLSEQCHS